MHFLVNIVAALGLSIIAGALPSSSRSQASTSGSADRFADPAPMAPRADADDAVAYAWVVGPPKQVKRAAEDADDAVAYAWVVGPSSKIKRAAEDADDAVAYAWVVGPSHS